MKKILKKLDKLGFGWLLVWGAIYVAFLVMGADKESDVVATTLKYGGLILCFIYVLLYARRDVYLVLAMGLTVIADGILVYNNVSEIGVGVFLLVQVAHLLRFTQIRSVSPLVPLLLAGLAVGFGLIQNEVPMMFVLAVAYAVLIFTNIYQVAKWYKVEKSSASKYALVGFLLFLLCDVCVGISYLTTTVTLPHFVTILANYMAWVFYLPAQISLALSGRRAGFDEIVEIPETLLDPGAESL
ncbi:hypothetical protein IJ103_02010 [Candidatus Saccharibacteria bacterium]|nr:hypothetical protein [Candidatus Saccharibacteria bacterium]MBQ9016998.1 hypothetical protein [Candidatus Saccharibacteria bacterium]